MTPTQTQRDVQAMLERHHAFWKRAPVDRPLISFTIGAGESLWSPWLANGGARRIMGHGLVDPDIIDVQAFVDDERRYLDMADTAGDDVWHSAMPLASIPWVEAIAGCTVERSEAHFKAKPVLESAADYDRVRFDPQNPWVLKYLEFMDAYAAAFGDVHPIGQSVLRGPSDITGSLLPPEACVMALMMDPDSMGQLLERVTDVLEQFIKLQLQHIPPFHGGQVLGQYELWAPGPIQRLQEDLVTLYSPDLFRRFLQPMDARLAAATDYSLMHLHTTSLFVIDDMLAIDRIQCYQISKDEGEVDFEAMVRSLVKIQERGRCLLVKGRFTDDDLATLKRRLSPVGLCLQPVVASVAAGQALLPKLHRWS